MNKREKEILQSQLNNEKAVLEKLKKTYEKALNDVNGRINLLLARNDANMQNVIYRIEYQKALKQEIQTILDKLHTDSFENISEYLTKCYEYGFCDTMYDLHGQDIPLIIPIDPAQVVDAVQHESKISEGLYKSIGKDITTLKKQIQNEISRGIASGLSYGVIARNIADYAGIAKNRAMTIARTDGHRIYIKSAIDAGEKAVKKGAHLVKQWNAAMDGLTRKTHRELDGQIRKRTMILRLLGRKPVHRECSETRQKTAIAAVLCCSGQGQQWMKTS